MAMPLYIDKLCNKRKLLLYVLLPLLSLAMHIHVFNRDLVGYHVWRQSQTQLNIENFAQKDFNIMNPRVNNMVASDGVYRMEFPIMQWLFACFYKIFGDHIIISRILTFIIGLFSVWGIYHLAHAVFKREPIALIAAWCFNFSPVFYYYTLNPLPDNFALCFAIWGMCYFFRWINEQKAGHLIFSAAFLCVATLAKLPFVVYLGAVSAYAVYGIIKKKIKGRTLFDIIFIFTFCFLPAAAWYPTVIGSWTGNGVVKGILTVQKSDMPELMRILQGNLISLLPEMLVNYGSLLFFLAGFFFMFKNKVFQKQGFHIFITWGIAVLLYFFFEMNMIGTVHDYYLFPFLPLIFLLVCYGAEQLFSIKPVSLKPVFVLALCILPLTAFLRINHRWNTVDPGFNPDLYKYKNELRSAAPDNALCIAGNDDSGNIWFYYLHKKGWNIDLDTLSGKGLRILIMDGAKYLYTDSPKTYNNEEVEKCFSKLVMEKGSMRVYELYEPGM